MLERDEIIDKDEVLKMARQAGMRLDKHNGGFVDASELKRFAKLVAAKERKEICGIVQQIVPITSWAHELLDAIRARGEA